MPVLNMSIPHSLPKEEAMYRMKRFLSNLRIRYAEEVDDVQEFWQANLARFDLIVRGKHLAGTLEVEEREILVALNYPPEDEPNISHMEAHIRDVVEPILR